MSVEGGRVEREREKHVQIDELADRFTIFHNVPQRSTKFHKLIHKIPQRSTKFHNVPQQSTN